MKYHGVLTILVVLGVGSALGVGAIMLDLVPPGILPGHTALSAESEAEHAHGPAGHSHAEDGQGKTSQVTVWGERFEVFLEHPFLVAGVGSEFVTHISDLTTGQPRTDGPVVFALTDESGAGIEHVSPAPARAGIYLPELVFPAAGRWAITLRVPVDGHEHVVVLPPVTVYASEAEADAAPAADEPEGISFLKEQQWPIGMRVEPVVVRPFGQRRGLAIPQSAVVEDHGEQIVHVQVAGETLQERHPELGQSGAGWVEVVSGLTEGERVVSGAVEAVVAAIADVSGEGHDHAHEEVALTGDRLERYDIETATVGPGKLERRATLTGEVKLDADKVAHIVPQVSGRVRQVNKNVGDTVAAGEVMAWLESAALGQAKIDYLSKLAEISCCSIELSRAREIHENGTRFLDALAGNPSLERLRDSDQEAMGKVRSDLISAFAELQYARTAYERERQLFDKKISSGDDFRRAESVLKKAEGLYAATRDRIAYEIQHNLSEATQAQRVRELEAVGAERTLYVLGLTQDDVRELQAFAGGPLVAGGDEEVCTDPNCTECAAAGQASTRENERLAWYALRAPFDATVISKHLSLGESVKDDADVYVVADLSTVWVDFRVYQQDLAAVKPGQTVVIASGPERVEGIITYVAPVVDKDTRTALARVELPNPSTHFRPGAFVSGHVVLERREVALLVDRSAVQYIDDQPCVFIYDGHAFDKRNVMLGRTDGKCVEITAGLQAGQNVVTRNAFRVKAEALKDTMGSGHGHVH